MPELADVHPAFSAAGTAVTLAPGEVLVAEGDDSDEVFVVVTGRLEAVHRTAVGPVVVGSAGPGEIVGEVTTLAGGMRRVTLQSADGAMVLRISRDDFVRVLDDHPDLAERLAVSSRDRLDRTQVVAMVTELAGTSDTELVQAIVDRVAWRRLAAGETLFEEGDESDAAYFIVSGRLQVTTVEGGVTSVLGEYGRGEVIGELGLLENAPRSATVRARRDSTLAVFPTDTFVDLASRWPSLMLHVSRGILTRLRRIPRRVVSRASTITIVATAPGTIEWIIDGVVGELTKFGRVERLSADRVDSLLGQPGIADLAPDEPGVPRLSEFLHDIDVQSDHVVLVSDPLRHNWTQRAVHQGDRIVILASAAPSEDEKRRIRELVDGTAAIEAERMLVLLHPSGVDRPRGTAALLDEFGLREVTHVRSGSAGDIERLARLATGNGVGLVLSGGGARGFAYLGVHRELLANGVPVDFVAGCSMGVPLAAGMAMSLTPDEIEATAKTVFVNLLDYTVPVVSLLKGKRITDRIRTHFGGWDIEDLWLPYYCVSTNLTHSRLEVHRRGDLGHAIRASCAIPGVLPPVPYGPDLLVDGGVLDNMPVEPLRSDGRVDTIIAVDVALRLGPSAPSDYGGSVSGVRALLSSVGRRSARYPSMGAVLTCSMLTGAVHNQRLAVERSDLDLLLRLDMPDVGLLAFERVHEVANRGRADVADEIATWAAPRPWLHRNNLEGSR